MAIVRRMGQSQNVVLLTLTYVVVLGPIWLILSLTRRSDLLELHSRAAVSFARPKQPVPTDADRCERPF
jgi:hypothetical protein